jgi:hypothetical protein
MDKWFKDIIPDKDPYHNRGRDQMRKQGGSGIRVPVIRYDNVTLIPLVLQLGLRVGAIQRMGAN